MIVYAFAGIIASMAGVYFLSRGNVYRFYLFVVFIFNLLPDVISVKLGESLPEIKPIQIFVLCLAIWMFAKRSRWKKQKLDKWLFYSLVVLLLIRLLSVFDSIDPALSLRVWVITLFMWFFMYLSTTKLVVDERHIDLLVKVLVLSALVVAFFNFFELFTGANLTQSVNFKHYSRYGISRVYGLLGDPVATAYYLLPIIPLGFYLYLKRREPKWGFITLFIIASIIPNFSRATFISLLLMLFAYGFFFNRKKTSTIIMTLAVVAALFLTRNVITKSIFNMISNIGGGDSSPTAGFDYVRFDAITSIGFTMISRVPFFGLGLGSLVRKQLMMHYFDKVGYLYVTASIRTELPIFFTMALECGVLASFAFAAVMLRGIKLSYAQAKNRKPSPNVLRFLFLSLSGYLLCLISNGVSNSLNLLFVLLGLIDASYRIMKKRKTLGTGEAKPVPWPNSAV